MRIAAWLVNVACPATPLPAPHMPGLPPAEHGLYPVQIFLTNGLLNHARQTSERWSLKVPRAQSVQEARCLVAACAHTSGEERSLPTVYKLLKTGGSVPTSELHLFLLRTGENSRTSSVCSGGLLTKPRGKAGHT